MSTYGAGYWPTYSYDNILNCIEKLIKQACVEYKSITIRNVTFMMGEL